MKNRSQVVLLVFSVIVSLLAEAQADSMRVMAPDSLSYRSPIFSFYPRLYNNGQRLTNEEALQLLSKEPPALADYKKYRNKQKVGLYSMAGMFGFIILSNHFFESNNRKAAAVAITLTVSSFINSIVFLSMADTKLRKAIRKYNQRSLRY